MKKANVALCLLASVLLLGACGGASSQSGSSSSSSSSSSIPSTSRTIKGTVTKGGSPLSGVSLSLRGSSYACQSKSDGSFSFNLSENDSKADSYTIQASFEGCKDVSKTISSSDFVDGIVDVALSMKSEYLGISGTVKYGETPLKDAKVYLDDGSDPVLTNSSGVYTLSILRPEESFSLNFAKDGYVTITKEVTEFDKDSITIDASLDAVSYSVSGVITDYLGNIVKGASVSIEGSDYSTTSAEDGTYSLNGLSLLELPYSLKVEKDGFSTATENVSETTATKDIALSYQEVDLGKIAPAIGDFSGTLKKEKNGLHFHFVSTNDFVYENGKEEKLQLYINVGESGASRSGGTVVEFAMTSNENIIVVWNHKTNSSVPNILWGQEVVYTHTLKDGQTDLDLFIDYTIFKTYLGDDFELQPNDIFGISMGEWSDINPLAWDGWTRTDMLGFNQSGFVHPEQPKDYIRVYLDNSLYQADNNEYIAKKDYVVKGNVTNESGTAMPGVTWSVAGTELTGTTDSLGNYEVTLSGVNFALVPNIIFDYEGYVSQTVTVARDLLSDGSESKDVVLKEEPKAINVSGKVTCPGGGVSGALVKIVGTENSVMTTADGAYSFSNIATDSAEYKLAITKDGFVSKTVDTTTDVTSLDIELATNPVSAGVFAETINGWSVTLNRDSKSLQFSISSSTADFSAPSGGDDMVSVFIAVGTRSDTRANSKVIELKMNPASWIGVWDYSAGGWATWTSDVAYSLSKVDGVTTLTASVTFDYINGLTGYSIAAGDDVGLSFCESRGSDWSGYSYGTFGFVDPIIPSDYVNWSAWNLLSSAK